MKKMTGLLVVVSVSLGSLVPVYAMEPQVGDVIELELGQLKPTQSSIRLSAPNSGINGLVDST